LRICRREGFTDAAGAAGAGAAGAGAGLGVAALGAQAQAAASGLVVVAVGVVNVFESLIRSLISVSCLWFNNRHSGMQMTCHGGWNTRQTP